MKNNTAPSLIAYFASCILFVVFSMLREENLVLYSKSIIIPSIFMYYLIRNNYKMDWIVGWVLLFSYAGDVYILMDYKDYLTSSIWCFLVVYLLMFYYVLNDFKTVKFMKKDILPISILILFFLYLLITVLDLQFKNTRKDFQVYLTYGVTLMILSCFAISNYIAKGSYCFLNLVLAVICFIVSDVFYSLNHFYYSLPVFEVITISAQVLSYYFLVNYFFYVKRA